MNRHHCWLSDRSFTVDKMVSDDMYSGRSIIHCSVLDNGIIYVVHDIIVIKLHHLLAFAFNLARRAYLAFVTSRGSIEKAKNCAILKIKCNMINFSTAYLSTICMPVVLHEYYTILLLNNLLSQPKVFGYIH